jgi:hypothetical protein
MRPSIPARQRYARRNGRPRSTACCFAEILLTAGIATPALQPPLRCVWCWASERRDRLPEGAGDVQRGADGAPVPLPPVHVRWAAPGSQSA